MGMPIEIQVGPVAVNAGDGAKVAARGGHTGEVIVQTLHGAYFESMARGLMYSAANQAAKAVSVALATTYTGLLLYNPIGSGVMLVPNKIKFALSVAPAGIATLGLISGFQTTPPTGLTALTVRSNQVGNSASGKGVVYSDATIATPVWHQQLSDGFTAAALPAPTPPTDLDGLIGILPGGFLAIGALTAVTGLGSIAWEEVPYNAQG